MSAGLLLAGAAALAVGSPVPIDDALLAGLPPVEASFTAHGQRHACTGVALGAVLARLGVPSGEKLRGPLLTLGLLAHARDGYAVLFSLGELDASVGAEPAVIATRCDGKALPDGEGPYRLVLPRDGRPARSVRQLDRLELRP